MAHELVEALVHYAAPRAEEPRLLLGGRLVRMGRGLHGCAPIPTPPTLRSAGKAAINIGQWKKLRIRGVQPLLGGSERVPLGVHGCIPAVFGQHCPPRARAHATRKLVGGLIALARLKEFRVWPRGPHATRTHTSCNL
eukprot:6303722-Prymnesium_polylepis.1